MDEITTPTHAFPVRHVVGEDGALRAVAAPAAPFLLYGSPNLFACEDGVYMLFDERHRKAGDQALALVSVNAGALQNPRSLLARLCLAGALVRAAWQMLRLRA